MNFKSFKFCGILLLSAVIFFSEKFTSNQVNATIKIRLIPQNTQSRPQQHTVTNGKLIFDPISAAVGRLNCLSKEGSGCCCQSKKDVSFSRVVNFVNELEGALNKPFGNYENGKKEFLKNPVKMFNYESDIFYSIGKACEEFSKTIGFPIINISKQRVNASNKILNICNDVIKHNNKRIENFDHAFVKDDLDYDRVYIQELNYIQEVIDKFNNIATY